MSFDTAAVLGYAPALLSDKYDVDQLLSQCFPLFDGLLAPFAFPAVEPIPAQHAIVPTTTTLRDEPRRTDVTLVAERLADLIVRLGVLQDDPTCMDASEQWMLSHYAQTVLGDVTPWPLPEDHARRVIRAYATFCAGLDALEAGRPGSVPLEPWPPTMASALPAMAMILA